MSTINFKQVINITLKNKSKENKFIYFLRSIYYKLIKKFSSVEQIEHFTGFGLYDKCFMDALRKFKEPYPYFRGLVSEIGFNRKEIKFVQPERKRGITKNIRNSRNKMDKIFIYISRNDR